jgi:type IV secretory pathway VirB2 component (pilin)
MAQGMNWGIMTLLVVIGCVLAGIASFFVYLGWRSSDRAPLTSGQSPTSED